MRSPSLRARGNRRAISTLGLLVVGSLSLGCSRDDPWLDANCQRPAGPGLPYVDGGEPCERLASYGLFDGFDEQGLPAPVDGTVVYELNSALFSDYTVKLRTITVPEGSQINYRDEGPFEFPVGTVISKTFAVADDLRKDSPELRPIETRILARTATGWQAWPYIWNADGSDAELVTIGRGGIALSWIDERGTSRSTDNYRVPDRIQCGECHRATGELDVIGPKAKHLNRDFHYDGDSRNQLEHWKELGILAGAPAIPATDAPRLPVWDDPSTGDLDRRARAYLDINCGHCHNTTSDVSTSGIDYTWDATSHTKLGVCKSPSAAGTSGSGGLRYDIIPGAPDDSIIIFRMDAEADTPNAMMPRLARSVRHDPAVELIYDWVVWLGTDEAAQRYPGIESAPCLLDD